MITKLIGARTLPYFALLLVLPLFLLTVSSATADQSGDGWNYAAGAHQDFDTSTCPDGEPPCSVVGTHTVVNVGQLTIDSAAPDGTYGFGVGLITATQQPQAQSYRHWAAYENRGSKPTEQCAEGRNGRCTYLRRACSIHGHTSYQPSPRTRSTTYTVSSPHDLRFWELNTTNVAVGIRMLMTAACNVQEEGCGTEPVNLRWECVFEEAEEGTPLREFERHQPMGAKIYLDWGEAVQHADHGFYVRNGPSYPDPSDSANMAFMDNRVYYFSDANPIEGCPTPRSTGIHPCPQDHPGDEWEHTDGNVELWPGPVGYYESGDTPPDTELSVYDRTDAMWHVCLNRGPANSACQQPLGDCVQVQLPWAKPRCQQASMWCSDAVSQSAIFNLTGLEPNQCDLYQDMTLEGDCPVGDGFEDEEVDRGLEAHGATRTLIDDVGKSREGFEKIREVIDSGNAVYVKLWNMKSGPQGVPGIDASFHAALIDGYWDCDDGVFEDYGVTWWYVRNCPSNQRWPEVEFPKTHAYARATSWTPFNIGVGHQRQPVDYWAFGRSP